MATLIGGPRQQAQPIGLHAVGDVELGAVDDPLVTIPNGASAQSRNVTAGVGLGHRDRGHHLAAQRRCEVALLQFVRPEAVQRRCGHVGLHAHGHGHPAGRAPAELLAVDRGVQVVGALTAEARVVLDAEHPERAELGEQLVGREHPRFLPCFGVRVDLLLDEVPHRLAEHLVLVAEPSRTGR